MVMLCRVYTGYVEAMHCGMYKPFITKSGQQDVSDKKEVDTRSKRKASYVVIGDMDAIN